MSDDKWLERVRKLLTLAEDPAATIGEAEAATAKATELMAKYGIEQAMLDAAKGRGERPVPGNRKVPCAPPYASEKIGLLNGIAQAMGVRCVRTNERGNGFQTLHMFGFESDMQRAEILYTSLLLQQITAMRHEEQTGAGVPYWDNIKSWRRSFLAGFGQAVTIRVDQAERAARRTYDATHSGPSTALVVADKSKEVDAAVADVYPRLRTGRSRSLQGSGGSRGRAAGNAANIGGTGVTAGSSRAVGR